MFVFFLAVLFPFQLLAHSTPLVTGVRANRAATERYAQVHGLSLLNEKTSEYKNGNTYVEFDPDIAQRDLLVLLPPEVSPDDLMEALIKVRTARTHGFNNIVAVSEGALKVRTPNSTYASYPVLSALRLAGATHHMQGVQPVLPLEDRRIPTPPAHPKDLPFVLNSFHRDLSTQIATTLRAPQLTNAEDARLRSGDGVVYLTLGLDKNINERLFDALGVTARLSKQGNRVHLVTPLLPYARSDKVDKHGTTVTGRLIADLIEGVGTSGITFVRAHSPQSQGFYSLSSVQLSGREVINRYLKQQGIEAIISPDNGFAKDATKHAEELGLPVGVINKVREGDKVRIASVSNVDVRGKRVAIIDDEIASGETLAMVAHYLVHVLGAAEVYAVATHMTGDGRAAFSCPEIRQIAFTNTVPVSFSHPKAVQLDLGGEISASLRSLEVSRANSFCERELIDFLSRVNASKN